MGRKRKPQKTTDIGATEGRERPPKIKKSTASPTEKPTDDRDDNPQSINEEGDKTTSDEICLTQTSRMVPIFGKKKQSDHQSLMENEESPHPRSLVVTEGTTTESLKIDSGNENKDIHQTGLRENTLEVEKEKSPKKDELHTICNQEQDGQNVTEQSPDELKNPVENKGETQPGEKLQPQLEIPSTKSTSDDSTSEELKRTCWVGKHSSLTSSERLRLSGKPEPSSCSVSTTTMTPNAATTNKLPSTSDEKNEEIHFPEDFSDISDSQLCDIETNYQASNFGKEGVRLNNMTTPTYVMGSCKSSVMQPPPNPPPQVQNRLMKQMILDVTQLNNTVMRFRREIQSLKNNCAGTHPVLKK